METGGSGCRAWTGANSRFGRRSSCVDTGEAGSTLTTSLDLLGFQARLPSIYDTMQSVVHSSVFLCLVLKSVCGATSAVVTNFIGLLERSVRAGHRRLRGGDGPARGRNDVRLQDIEST